MPRLQIIIFLTLLAFLFSCKDTNSSASPNPQEKEELTKDTSSVVQPEKIEYYSWVDKLRLREKPDTKSKVVAELAEGSTLTYLYEKTEFTQQISLRGKAYDEPWYKVRTTDGIIGWVYGGGILRDKPLVDALPTPYDKCFEILEQNYKSYEICVSRTKSRQLAKDKQYVRQLPKKLQLNLLSGATKILADDQLEGTDDFVSYDYRYYIPQMGFFVVEAFYHEDGGFILINDKSGSETKIEGYPRPAPDYKHLLTINADVEAGFRFNGFQLWGYTGNGFKKLMEEEMKDYKPVSARWLDKQTAEIQIQPAVQNTALSPMLLLLKQDKSAAWNLTRERVEE